LHIGADVYNFLIDSEWSFSINVTQIKSVNTGPFSYISSSVGWVSLACLLEGVMVTVAVVKTPAESIRKNEQVWIIQPLGPI